MTSAQYEQKKFWNIFEEKLIENGNPFSICYEVNGEIKYYGAVNKSNAWVSLGLTIDFLYRQEIVKINIYIQNDVRLFDYVYSHKEQIEQELGFSPEWILCGTKNPNTRRAISKFPVKIGDLDDYDRVIDEILPYVMQYKKVFQKYIPNLFEF